MPSCQWVRFFAGAVRCNRLGTISSEKEMGLLYREMMEKNRRNEEERKTLFARIVIVRYKLPVQFCFRQSRPPPKIRHVGTPALLDAKPPQFTTCERNKGFSTFLVEVESAGASSGLCASVMRVCSILGSGSPQRKGHLSPRHTHAHTHSLVCQSALTVETEDWFTTHFVSAYSGELRLDAS